MISWQAVPAHDSEGPICDWQIERWVDGIRETLGGFGPEGEMRATAERVNALERDVERKATALRRIRDHYLGENIHDVIAEALFPDGLWRDSLLTPSLTEDTP